MATDTRGAKTDSSVRDAGDSKGIDWKAVAPKSVEHEDSMSPDNVKVCWEKIYKAARILSADEATKRSLRLALYAYAAVNGTSRVGNYGKRVTLSGGNVVEAAVIPQSVGKFNIRQFFRGNMTEAYEALKSSQTLALDSRFVAKWQAYGIDASVCYAVADFLDDCPHFTPEEERAHSIARTQGIERSRRARGGKGLEAVEQDERDLAMNVQGPLDAAPEQSSKW